MLKFLCIDYWGRPVFMREGSDRLYGSTDKLFNYGASEEEVLAEVTEDDLCYFGVELDDDPHGGTLPANLKIQRS